MPRIARVVAVGAPHHVTQRGNNRQQVFFSNSQRRTYLALLAEHAARHQLRVLGYCLMPNHVHVIAVPERLDSLAKAFGRAHNEYSRYLNAVRRRSGHLWQNRFYSAPLGRDHLLRALRYVDLNPLRARLVERAMEFEWSSARGHVRSRDPAGLLDMEEWRRLCPLDDWEEVLEEPAELDEGWSARLRDATRCGKPLGNKDFVGGLQSATGVDLEIRSPGRPATRQRSRVATGGAYGS